MIKNQNTMLEILIIYGNRFLMIKDELLTKILH